MTDALLSTNDLLSPDAPHSTDTLPFPSLTLYPPQTLDSLIILVFAIVNHPEVQAKAKAELNAVVGTGRMPDFADRPRLPYIERIIQETFRCGNPAIEHAYFHD